MAGTGQISPILSCIDPGQTKAEAPTSVNLFSRARTAMIHKPDGATRSVNYRGWLSDNVANPYLLTYNEDTATRELYQNPNQSTGDES
jgi:hypothetical protein